MRSETYHMEMNDYERRALLGVLTDQRNERIKTNKPSEDVTDLLEKALDAKPKKDKKRRDRDRDER